MLFHHVDPLMMCRSLHARDRYFMWCVQQAFYGFISLFPSAFLVHRYVLWMLFQRAQPYIVRVSEWWCARSMCVCVSVYVFILPFSWDGVCRCSIREHAHSFDRCSCFFGLLFGSARAQPKNAVAALSWRIVFRSAYILVPFLRSLQHISHARIKYYPEAEFQRTNWICITYGLFRVRFAAQFGRVTPIPGTKRNFPVLCVPCARVSIRVICLLLGFFFYFSCRFSCVCCCCFFLSFVAVLPLWAHHLSLFNIRRLSSAQYRIYSQSSI